MDSHLGSDSYSLSTYSSISSETGKGIRGRSEPFGRLPSVLLPDHVAQVKINHQRSR